MLPAVREPITVDCRGMQCPAPILRLSEVVRRRRGQGGTLTVLATDVDFPVDLDAWCRTTKARVVRLQREPDGLIRAEVALPEPASPEPSAHRATIASPRGIHADLSDTQPSREVILPDGQRASQAPSLPPEMEEAIDLRGSPLAVAMRTLNAAAAAKPGALARVTSDAPGFEKRLGAWATAMDASIESMEWSGAAIRALVRFPADPGELGPIAPDHRGEAPRARAQDGGAEAIAPAPVPSAAIVPSTREDRCTLLVMRNDLEALLTALMVANASAAQGLLVEVYFAFWGIHLLRGRSSREARGEAPGLLQRMMLWFVPEGPRQQLGKLHMGGLGTRVLLRLMRKRNVLELDQLLTSAADQGVRFRVCSMSMGLMGLRESDIVDMPNIDFAGVTSFAEAAARSRSSFVF